MTTDTLKTVPSAAVVALACGLGAPDVANADEHWTVEAIFTDGGTVNGYFDINAYGYLGDFNLQTSANGPFGGFDFVPATAANQYIAGGSTPGSSEATFF